MISRLLTYHIVPNKRACSNKHPHPFEFHCRILANTQCFAMKFPSLTAQEPRHPWITLKSDLGALFASMPVLYIRQNTVLHDETSTHMWMSWNGRYMLLRMFQQPMMIEKRFNFLNILPATNESLSIYTSMTTVVSQSFWIIITVFILIVVHLAWARH